MSNNPLPPGKREASDDVDSPDASDSKRRKAVSSSSRGVANLTPEQLAKKRQNDREAQRAIRERTKNQIDTLERRIRDLTSQQPYQELQHVLRQKESAELENAEIKKRLASVMSTIEPILGNVHHQVYNAYASPSQPAHISQRRGSTAAIAVGSGSNVSSPAASTHTAHWHVPVTSTQSTETRNFTNDREFQQQRHNLAHGLNIGQERLGLSFLLDENRQNLNKLAAGLNGVQEHGDTKQDMVSVQRSASNLANGDVAAHSALPRNGPPTCPLDTILLDFLYARQKQAEAGVETPKLVGPAYPSVSSLLNPAHSVKAHPLSRVFTDILGTFPDLSTLPERVAVLYIMFLIMRWQIAPTQENYDRLPDWATPRPSQLFTPHPAWIDHLPFPRMRDKLVRDYNPRDYLFDNFFPSFTTTLSLNWPYEPTDALLSSSESDELMINPVFERHLRRLENWSLGEEFLQAMPGLEGTFRLKNARDRRDYTY